MLLPRRPEGGWRVQRSDRVLSVGGSAFGVFRSVSACVFMGTVSCLALAYL